MDHLLILGKLSRTHYVQKMIYKVDGHFSKKIVDHGPDNRRRLCKPLLIIVSTAGGTMNPY
jgi:hypothetical protein